MTGVDARHHRLPCKRRKQVNPLHRTQLRPQKMAETTLFALAQFLKIT